MRIGQREVGPGQSCFIVAEISANHNGSLDRALALIHAAKEAGADAVKFQAFTLDEILGLRGEGQAPAPWDIYTNRELYMKALTPHDWFPTLFGEARGLGLIPFASVFGAESLALLESLDCPAYKIAKSESSHRMLLSLVEATGKPILRSAWDLHCPGGYPCRHSDLHLSAIRRCGDFGLSCHCPDPAIGPLAVVAGAHYLEFHLTLDDGVPTLDDCVNLTASQFAEMVRLTRKAETML